MCFREKQVVKEVGSIFFGMAKDLRTVMHPDEI